VRECIVILGNALPNSGKNGQDHLRFQSKLQRFLLGADSAKVGEPFVTNFQFFIFDPAHGSGDL
jgi:hypothetical protein